MRLFFNRSINKYLLSPSRCAEQSSMLWENQGHCSQGVYVPVGKMDHKQVNVNKPNIFKVQSYANFSSCHFCPICPLPGPHFSTLPGTSCFFLTSLLIPLSEIYVTHLYFAKYMYLLRHSPYPLLCEFSFLTQWSLSFYMPHYILDFCYNHVFICLFFFFLSRE